MLNPQYLPPEQDDDDVVDPAPPANRATKNWSRRLFLQQMPQPVYEPQPGPMDDPAAGRLDDPAKAVATGPQPVYKPQPVAGARADIEERPGALASAMPQPVYNPRIIPNSHGTPVNAVGAPDRVGNQTALLQAQEDAVPENHNSRLAGVGLGARRGFQRGGVMGAIIGAIRGGVDKSADERDKRGEEVGKTRSKLQESIALQNQATQNAHVNAETAHLLQPSYHPPNPTEVLDTTDGFVIADKVTGQTAPLRDQKTGVQLKKRDLSADEDMRQDPANPHIWRVFKNGKPTSRTFVRDPKHGDIPSGQAATAEALNADRKARADRANLTIEQRRAEIKTFNEGIDKTVSALQKQLDSMGPKPPEQISGDSITEYSNGEKAVSKKMEHNPAYKAYMDTFNDLTKQMREANAKRKAPPVARPAGLSAADDTDNLFAGPDDDDQ